LDRRPKRADGIASRQSELDPFQVEDVERAYQCALDQKAQFLDQAAEPGARVPFTSP